MKFIFIFFTSIFIFFKSKYHFCLKAKIFFPTFIYRNILKHTEKSGPHWQMKLMIDVQVYKFSDQYMNIIRN